MIIKKILTRGLFLFLMLFPIAVGVVTPQLALAQNPPLDEGVDAKWINLSTIEVDGQKFIDVNPYDGNHEYQQEGAADGAWCVNRVIVNAAGDGKQAVLARMTPPARDPNGCEINESTINLKDESERWVNAYRVENEETIVLPQIVLPNYEWAERAGIFLRWPSGITLHNASANYTQTTSFSGKLSPGDGGKMILTGPFTFKVIPESNPPDPDRDPNVFYLFVDNKIWVGDDSEYVKVELNEKKQISKLCYGVQIEVGPIDTGRKCDAPSIDLVFKNGGEIIKEGSDVDVPDASEQEPSCEASGFGLAWVFCPLIEGLAKASDEAYENIIQPMLKGDTIDTSPTSPVYQAWSQFRIYANILLVIALLVVVFGQAIGGGLIDAYTAKKMLPRILLAAVLINLSLYIVSFAVDITNIVAAGLGAIIAAPFEGVPNVILSGGSGLALGASLGIAGTIGAAFALGGFGATLSFLALFILLPGFLAIVSVMFTLILRQALLYFLIFVSPIAFAAFVLPNTEKLFKTWWNFLYKALLVYVVIEVIFAMCFIMPKVLNLRTGTGGITGVFGALASIVLLLMPLFLIPFAFKLAGGAIGSLYGTLSGIGKKTTEAVKGNPNDPESLRNRKKREAMGAFTQSQQRFVDATKDNKSSLVRGISGAARFGQLSRRSAKNVKEAKERHSLLKDNGDDTLGRASVSVPLFELRDAAGVKIGETDQEFDASGARRARAVDDLGRGKRITLGGKAVNDEQYALGKKDNPTDADQQFWIDYELGKVSTGTSEDWKRRLATYSQQEGKSIGEREGAFAGATFGHAGETLAKYDSMYEDGAGNLGFRDISDPKMNFDPETRQRGKNDERLDDVYYKRGPYQNGMLMAGDMHTLFDIRDHHASQVRDLTAKQAAGTITAQEQLSLDHSKGQLRKFESLQRSWAGSGAPVPGTNPADGPAYSSLSGANQGIQDAFKERSMAGTGEHVYVDPDTGRTTAPPTPVGPGTPGAVAF